MSSAPAAPSAAIRVLLVVDVRLYREGLAAILPADVFAVVGAAATRGEAIAAVENTAIDLVIVDASMPEALDLMKELRRERPALPLIALGVDDDIDAIVQCAESGAAAYVSASDGVSHLVKTIAGVIGGELHCSPRVAAELFRRIGDNSQNGHRDDGHRALSNREHQVFTLLRKRLTNKEIAVSLNISEATVKNHVHHLLEKLQVSNRVKAAACIPVSSRAPVKTRQR